LSIPISPRKLNDLVDPIRRIHVDEALTQLRLSRKRKAVIVFNVLRTARVHAINNFRMDPARLVVDEVVVGKGQHLKRIDIKARGHYGMRRRYRSHLQIAVREIPPQPGETKLGLWGPKHVTRQRTLARLKALGVAARFISQSPTSNYPLGAPAAPFISSYIRGSHVRGTPRPEAGWYNKQSDWWLLNAKQQQQQQQQQSELPALDAAKRTS